MGDEFLQCSPWAASYAVRRVKTIFIITQKHYLSHGVDVEACSIKVVTGRLQAP